MPAGIFRNRVTEKDIRNWLDQNGFYGRSAVISDLELHAIKRPGWRQVFRFTVEAKRQLDSPSILRSENNGKETHFGIVVDDQRKRTEAEQTQVSLFTSIDARDQRLEKCSAGLVTCAKGQGGDLTILAVGVIIFIVMAIALGSLVGT